MVAVPGPVAVTCDTLHAVSDDDTLTAPHLPPLDVLVPGSEHLPLDPREQRLADLYAVPAGPHVRVNMVHAVDGAAWGPDHRTGSINDDADYRVFRLLRALADVVVVGAGTARTERYTALDRPLGLEHLNDAPLELALVTRSGRVPDVLAGAERPPYVLTGAEGAVQARAAVPQTHLVVADGRDGSVDLVAGLAALAARGLTRALCEGGPVLLGAMLEAGLVDELCVTTTPQLVGPGPGRIVGGAWPAGAMPPGPLPARLGHLLLDPRTGTTLARWVLRGTGA